MNAASTKGAGDTRRPRSCQEMRDQEIRWLVERTGEGLERAPNFGQSSVTHKIGLATADEIDPDFEECLKKVYAVNS